MARRGTYHQLAKNFGDGHWYYWVRDNENHRILGKIHADNCPCFYRAVK